MKTVGNENTLSWRDNLSNDFRYGITLNVHDARTFIRSYPGNSTKSIWNFNNGREIGEIWGYETVGIAKTQEEMDAHLEAVGGQTALGSEWSAGDIMYADRDGKPGINSGAETLDDHGDLKVFGNSTPRYFFGADLSASYKGFDMRAFIQEWQNETISPEVPSSGVSPAVSGGRRHWVHIRTISAPTISDWREE